MSSPSKQRHFIKASTLIEDESDEIVHDLMNLVQSEQLKTHHQGPIKRHASIEHISSSDEHTMNKKRYFQTKEKIPSRIDGQLLRPQILINRYGDIGNYVPKFLRENITTRSSDSNENIFFRSTHGQLLNGFLKLDVLANNHYQSTPCLTQT
jgi:hypothetical protein